MPTRYTHKHRRRGRMAVLPFFASRTRNSTSTTATASLLLLLSSSSLTSAAAFLTRTPYSRSSPLLHQLQHRPLCSSRTPIMASSSESTGLADIGGGGGQTSKQQQEQDRGQQRSNDKPQWLVQLERALHRNGKDAHSRYVQLATVGEEAGADGASFLRPYVRTVVYRGALNLEGQYALKMITDARSEKIGHLARHPHAEIAWYFTKSREQFRVFGAIHVVTAADGDKALQGQRKHQWGCLSDNAKVQFLWPHPKHPLPDRDAQPAAELEALFNPPIPEPSTTPPDTFCLLLFKPVRIDHLELKASPQRRTLHVKKGDGAWVVEPVNP